LPFLSPFLKNDGYIRESNNLYCLPMALKMIQYGTQEYEQMIVLRRQILRKPLGLDFSKEELAKEEEHVLLGCFDDEVLEGCCMLVEKSQREIRLRQLAVLSGLQGKGIGRVLMVFAENVARDRRYQKIIMHARISSIPFFDKLGYTVVGEPFIELTIQHVVMEKEL
jgi:predicted GNAT family N-acyltransferase